MFLIPGAVGVFLSDLLAVFGTENDALDWGWNKHQIVTYYNSSSLYSNGSLEDSNAAEFWVFASPMLGLALRKI